MNNTAIRRPAPSLPPVLSERFWFSSWSIDALSMIISLTASTSPLYHTLPASAPPTTRRKRSFSSHRNSRLERG